MKESAHEHPWITEHRRAYELALMLAVVGSALLAVGGSVTASVAFEDSFAWGVGALAASLAVGAMAMVLSYPLRGWRVLYRRSSGGTRYEQLKRWTHLKALSVLLNLLTILAAAVLAGTLAYRIEPFQVAAPFPVVLSLTTLLTLVLLVNQALCHHQSLRARTERPSLSGVESVFFYLGVAGTLAFAIAAVVLSSRPLTIPGVGSFRPTDAPFFLLAGSALASLALIAGRPLPTLLTLFTQERDFYAHTYLSRSKSIVMPVMMAFALLFLVVLVLLLFGVGIVGLVEEIPRNTVLIGVFGFIIIAMVTSVSVAVLLSRSEDRATLYKLRRSAEAKQGILVLGVSAAFTTVFLVLAALLTTGSDALGMAQATWTDFFALALLSALGPYGFLAARRYQRIRRLEERFPDFLRDIAASRKAGLTLTEAVTIASKGEYGALTPEIVKMADQLSWDVPFGEALQRFGERVKTPLVQRAVSLVNEASRSGGNVTDVLLAAARDAREIKNLETERRMTMGLYTAIIYITFFVFLSVVAVLYGTFIPEILKTSNAVVAQGGGGIAGLAKGLLTLEDYRVFYFLAGVVQGLGNGFVAGLIESGKWLSGLRHSFLMVLITWVAFAVMAPAAG